MSYPYRYYRYLNLPCIPDDIIAQINRDYAAYERKNSGQGINKDVYVWSDSFNQVINDWCQKNICPEMYWGFQIIRGDMKPHLDNVTISKMNYVIDPGGSDVMTEWYDPDGITVIDSVVLESHRWHILKVDTLHGVKNLDPGAVRFGITGRIF
jgi:hypothetical protein